MNKLWFLLAVLFGLTACSDEAEKIGEASTVFNVLGKNDRIEIVALDDPDVAGVSCFLSYAKKGGLKEFVNLEEDTSDASITCLQTAPVIRFNEKHVLNPQQIFKRNSNLTFKSMQIVRYYDQKRKTFSYLVYSDKIIEGSPKNSLTAFSCYQTPATEKIADALQIGSCIIDVSK